MSRDQGERQEARVVDFPLRGEWVAYHTPAERIPSHGTDRFGQRYAFDFMRIERAREDWKFYRPAASRYLLLGVGLQDCYGWSAPIHAPFQGRVVIAADGWPERDPVHPLRDLAVVIKNALGFDPRWVRDLRVVLGNHLVLQWAEGEVFALFAHARCGSIRVVAGSAVMPGQHLAEVGHSGNSTAPHLHFQLMDRADVLEARGLPCRFREYEALHDGAWTRVRCGIPAKREFVRYGG